METKHQQKPISVTATKQQNLTKLFLVPEKFSATFFRQYLLQNR